MATPSGAELYGPLFDEAAVALKKGRPALSVVKRTEDRRLEIRWSGDPAVHMEVGVAQDHVVARRFYLSLIIRTTLRDARYVEDQVRRRVGPIQYLPGPFSTELRRWSPYQAIDGHRRLPIVRGWIVEAATAFQGIAWPSFSPAAPQGAGSVEQVRAAPGQSPRSDAGEADDQESMRELIERIAGPFKSDPQADRVSTVSRSPGFIPQGYVAYSLFSPKRERESRRLLIGVSRSGDSLSRADGKVVPGKDSMVVLSPEVVASGLAIGRCRWEGDQLVADRQFLATCKKIAWRGLPNFSTRSSTTPTLQVPDRKTTDERGADFERLLAQARRDQADAERKAEDLQRVSEARKRALDEVSGDLERRTRELTAVKEELALGRQQGEDQRAHFPRQMQELGAQLAVRDDELAALRESSGRMEDVEARRQAEYDQLLAQWMAADERIEELGQLNAALVLDLEAAGGNQTEQAGQAQARPVLHELLSRIDQAQGLTPRLQLEIVHLMLQLAPNEDEFMERQGVLLARLEQFEDALHVLSRCTELSSDGATASVTSALRLGRAPEPLSLIHSVDWTSTTTLDEAVRAATRLPTGSATRLGSELADILPIDACNRYYEALVGRRLDSEDRIEVLTAWLKVDGRRASAALIEALNSRRIDGAIDWVERTLRTVVMELGDAAAQLGAVEWLSKRMRDQADIEGLVDLLATSAWRVGGSGLVAACDLVVEAALQVIDRESAGLLVDGATDAIRHGYPRARAEVLLAPLAASLDDASLAVFNNDIRTRAADHGAGPTIVTNVADAARAVAARYPALVFLEEAFESAKQVGSATVAKLHDALEALGATATRWHEGGLGRSLDLELDGLGIGYRRDISKTAKTEFRASYERRLPSGDVVVLGPHIAVGNKSQLLRVYMYFDRGNRLIVVGHIGKHLPDRTSDG